MMKTVRAVPGSSPTAPSSLEILLALAGVLGVRLFLLAHANDYWTIVRLWYDNPDYLRIVTALEQRTWSCDPNCPTHAWGLPYAILAMARAFRLSNVAALAAVSIAPCFPALWLIRRLYGGWVAAAMLAASYTWIMMATNGGSEPLFLCLLFAGFACARAGRTGAAAAFMTMSAMVRPIGLLAVAVIGLDAFIRRDRKDIVTVCVVTAGLMALYLLPIVVIAHDPRVTYQGYQGDWFPGGLPSIVPFVALVPNWLWLVGISPLAAATTAVCFAMTIVGIGRLWWVPPSTERRLERVFATVYVFFMIVSPFEGIAFHFPRYMLPVFPMVFGALEDWLPRSRTVMWPMALASGTLRAGIGALARSIVG